MSNLVDIVRGIVEAIDLNIVVNSTDGTRIYVCKTLHITVGKIIEDELGNTYKVTAISNNEWIDVEPYGVTTDPFGGTTVVAPSILFLHGSPSSTNKEYLKTSPRTLEKTPFIWLLESYEYENTSRESSIVASYNARMFFMDWAAVTKWINDQHNNLAIKPMENLVGAFRNVIESDYSFKTLEDFRTRVRPRFGVEVANKGSDDKIINEDLSGVEVNMTIELYDLSICNC